MIPELYLPPKPAIVRPAPEVVSQTEFVVPANLPGMMPVVLAGGRTITFEETFYQSAASPAWPSSAAVGDLVVHTEHAGNGSDLGNPAGWTRLGSTRVNTGGAIRSLAVMAKVVEAADLLTTIPRQHSGGSTAICFTHIFRRPGGFSTFAAGAAFFMNIANSTASYSENMDITGAAGKAVIVTAYGSSNGNEATSLTNNQTFSTAVTDNLGTAPTHDTQCRAKLYQAGDPLAINAIAMTFNALRYIATGYIVID
jgi:hypothetical protein